jgi:eukaryotic-like serine/threonine-protein kinase
MGTVFRCRDENLERDVAVKVMSMAQLAEPDARMRFVREARAAARLQHPNIITIYELDEYRGTPYIVMELLDGVDLQRAITAGVRPDPRVTLPIVLQILAGLQHAHEHGIVHRDIKPSNIFLPRGRPAKIMDFGVARLASGATTAGTIVGTPNYMSPEQVKGAPVDGRSDLFSAGLILYELVTGERAFTGGSVVAVLFKIANERPDLSLLPRASQWERLRKVVTRALAQDSRARYPEAHAMAAELMQALDALGGVADWASASDRGLVVRHTPRPSLRPLDSPTVESPALTPEPPEPIELSPTRVAAAVATEERPQLGTPWRWTLVGLVALSAVVLVVAVIVLLWLRRGGRETTPPRQAGNIPLSAPLAATPSPLPPSTIGARATPLPSTAALAPGMRGAATLVTRVTPAGATPASLLLPPTTRSGSATPTVARQASPAPTAATTPAPVAANPRNDRANALFEAGRFQSALNEARAVLAREPANEEARAIAEDASAALLVEEKLRRARAALAKGDRARALAEVQAGMATAPNDARLLALYRQIVR